MIEHVKEKKSPAPEIGARIDELIRYHRAYKRAFVRGDAMGSLVWLLGRALSVPEVCTWTCPYRHLRPWAFV